MGRIAPGTGSGATGERVASSSNATRADRGAERRKAYVSAGVTTIAALATCSALAFASERDVPRLGFLRWFRHEGRGVATEGTALLALFAVAISLTLGAFAAGGRAAVFAMTANLAVKATLLAAVGFMFAFPDLPQFEHKSLTVRAILYPTLAGLVPALYAVRRMRGPYPILPDLCWSLALTVDVIGNDLHWYGNWRHWDDAVHFLNTLPLMFLIVPGTLVLARRGVVRIGFPGAALFGLMLYTSLHGLWEMSEYLTDRIASTQLQPGGMDEAARNSLSSIAGSLLAFGLLYWWNCSGFLERAFVAPMLSYASQLARGRSLPQG